MPRSRCVPLLPTRSLSQASRLLARLAACLLCFAAWLNPAHDAAATDFLFTKIVDTDDVRPGTADPFSLFSDFAYDGQNVAFIGNSLADEQGVYLWNGSTLSTVANEATASPQAIGTFSEFNTLALDQGNVAFVGEGTSVTGVYTTLGGPLRRVADTTTTMPGSSVPFTAFDFGTDVDISGQRVAFSAFGTNGSSIFNEGAYLEDSGFLSVVADRSDTIPGFGDTFIFFGDVDVDQNDVLFDAGRGSGGGNGFYTTNNAPPGSYRIVYNSDTPLPGLTQPNSIFSPNPIALDGGDVLFEARGDNDFDAIFIDRNGSVETVVDEATSDPETGSNFRSFFTPSLDSGDAAFMGFSNGPTGLYLYDDGALTKVINSMDFLDGKDVSSVGLKPGSLKSGEILFRANFTDGSSGLYLAAPEPTGEPQTISVEPTVDVLLNTDDLITIQDGAEVLAVDGGFGDSFPPLDVLMEFPIDQVPADAELLSATLQLDPVGASGSTQVVVDGYAGDGLASTSDASASTTELAVSPGLTAGAPIEIDLDTAFIEAILGSASHLGLRLSSLTSGPFLNFASTESTTDDAPALVLEFQVAPSGGDADADGDVDVADILAIQRGEGGYASFADGLTDWQPNFGNGGQSQEAIAAVPEPLAVSLLWLSLATIALRRSGATSSP